ncbi:hypothetical protein BH23VER1_BH23VER1_21050 [soil metagenome]
MNQSVEIHSQKDLIGRRALEGLVEGACWGAVIGFLKGIIRIFRSDRPWFKELGGTIVLGIILGSVVCAIGKAISGRYLGAWLGTVPGVLIGWFAGSAIGSAFGSYDWKVTEVAGGTTTMVGYPIGGDIGLAAGALLGAVIGALIHRLVINRAEFNQKEPFVP